MRVLRPVLVILVVIIIALAATTGATVAGQDAGRPQTGQPAADVLASQDIWGNPTFIGGLTNSGPTAHSVW